MSMIEKTDELEQIPYFRYFITYKDWTMALLDLRNKVNAMSQAFTFQPGFKMQKTNIEAQKIDDITLEIYEIVVSTFFMLDKDKRKRFFKKSFLLTNVNPDIMLEMLFLTMNNVDIDFQAWDLQ